MNLMIIGGSGLLGSTTAFYAGTKGLFDKIYLLGTRQNIITHHVMDMNQALCPVSDTRIEAGKYEDIRHSDIILITAGMKESPTQSRTANVRANFELMRKFAEQIKAYSKSPKPVICATNPVDVLNYSLYKLIGWPKKYFLGFGYNDTLRLRFALSEETGAPYKSFEAYVIGEHGENQVPLFEHILFEGKPFALDEALLTRVKTRIGSFFTVMQALDANRTSGWTSAVALTKLINALINETDEVIPCSAVLQGEYGQHNVSLGALTRLGKDGIKSIAELELSKNSEAMMQKAADCAAKHISSLGLE